MFSLGFTIADAQRLCEICGQHALSISHELPFPGGRRAGNRLAVYIWEKWEMVVARIRSDYLRCLTAIRLRNWFSLTFCFLGRLRFSFRETVERLEVRLPMVLTRWVWNFGCTAAGGAFREPIATQTYISINDGLFKRKIGQGERRREESKGGKQENREAVAKGQADVQSNAPSSSIR